MDAQQLEEHVEAQAQLWNYMYGFAQSAALRCAAELGIAEIINDQPDQTISLSQLAAALPVPSPNKERLYRIMRFLVHMQLFTLTTRQGRGDETERYELTPAAKLLLKDNPKSMFTIIAAHGEISKPLGMLTSCLEGNQTVYEKMYGVSYWQFLAGDPENYKLFDAAMARDTRNFMPLLINGCRHIFKGINSLVDVGGGSGTAVSEIANAFPHLKCTLYDLPHVIDTAPHDPRVEHIAGDMFKLVPHADAIFLKNVLHDWPDEECIKILRQCKEAIAKNCGKVIIVDVVVDWDAGNAFTNTRYFWDLQMMVTAGGKERSEKEFKILFDTVGFSRYEIIDINAVQSAIVVYP